MKRAFDQPARQYTIRSIPPEVDAALRRKARELGRSLNQVALEALIQAADLAQTPAKRRDLSDLAGQWEPDRQFDQAIAEMDRVDPELWS